MGWLPVAIVICALLAVGALFLGIGGFVRGGEFNRKYGNRLMQLRVLFQLGAVLLLMLLFFLAKRG